MDQMQRRHHHNNNNHPCNVDECAVNFAFLGPFLFSGNGLLLSTKGSRFQAQEKERLLKPGGTGAMLEGSDSVSPVSSLLKNSSVVHVASFEPLLEEKRSDIHYLPEFIDLSSKKRLVYIDIGAADHLTTRSNWFFPSYPIEKKAFNSYFVHHNTLVLTSYVKSPGVTFIYHPGLAAATKSGTGDQEKPFVEDDSFDFLEWFKETTSFADFVVLKMNTSGAEMKSLSLS
ncbi:hypothetical protein Bca4012_095138 [Brassica carinata]